MEDAMTVNEAIRTARQRVSLCSFGRQYTVHCWSPEHNATWVSHPMDWFRARAIARVDRIRNALFLLGIEDAGWEATNLAEQTGTWESLVRSFVSK
jgi:hypothetical protein